MVGEAMQWEIHGYNHYARVGRYEYAVAKGPWGWCCSVRIIGDAHWERLGYHATDLDAKGQAEEYRRARGD